jgi:hypothetical protein
LKRGPAYKWIPLWVDKWLWGSTRHELNHDERAIFIDLMALASKDDGHIRANEQTPYPVEQLAGMLNASIELLKSTLSKCIKFSKITEKEGFYFINNWNEYRLTGGYKRAVTALNKAHTASASKSMYKSKSSSLNKNLKEAMAAWNDFAQKWNLRPIQEIEPGSTREAHLRARMKKKEFSFEALLQKIEKQPFLLGKNDKAWTVSFDWILCPSNYTKIIEEQYPARAPRDDAARDRRVGMTKRPISPEEKEAQEKAKAEFQGEKKA